MLEHRTYTWARSHSLLIVVCIFFILDIVLLYAFLRLAPGVLKVTFLDVGQGDAILIEAPNGNQILYDAGPPSGAVLRELSKHLPFWDRAIDVVVLSHPDMDHIGGFPEIFKRYKISVVLTSGARSENGIYDKTEQSIADEGSAHIIARKGMSIQLGSGVVADVLYPNAPTQDMETNSASIVLRVRYGDTAFLFTGDLPLELENNIVREFGNGLKSDVVKLGHHGSRTSTSPYWLAAVDPKIAVISVGGDNRYGHPHAEVLALTEKLGITTLKTSEERNISFVSDGEVVTRR